MRKGNIVDEEQICYENFNLSMYLQCFIKLFASAIDYVFLKQQLFLSTMNKSVDIKYMSHCLHQSYRDIVSYHYHHSKSLLRITSLSVANSMIGSISIFLCKNMIFITNQCREAAVGENDST